MREKGRWWLWRREKERFLMDMEQDALHLSVFDYKHGIKVENNYILGNLILGKNI